MKEMNGYEWVDNFGEILTGPVIYKTWNPEDSDEFKDMLNFESYIVLEDVWGKLRKILDNCKDNCKRQGILIALRIVEEKMTEYEIKIWGKEKAEKWKEGRERNYKKLLETTSNKEILEDK